MSLDRKADPGSLATPRPGQVQVEPDAQPLVLVVDDEALVRKLVCAVLSRLGWRTLEAANGAEALLVRADAGIDLLITDYEMPGIKGIEVADAFRIRSRDLPVVVISGLATIGQLANSRGFRFLSKPFEPGELLALASGLRPGRAAAAPAHDTALSSVPRVVQRAQTGSVPLRAPGRFGSSPDWNRATGTRGCTLRCFPRDDPQFEADANSILLECTRIPTWAGVLEHVRRRLVQLYPGAVVYPRDPLAANGDPNEYWYCYRDGGL
jgi:CheY-like chemotaxis protein